MANVYGTMSRRKPAGKPDVFMGSINIPGGIAGEIAFIPISRRGENSPSYDVKIKSSGDWATLGKAWTKEFKERAGEFYTATIDGPMMAKPVNLTAFPLDDEFQPKEWDQGDEYVEYEIVWQRPRKRAESSGIGASGDADLDDDIPY